MGTRFTPPTPRSRRLGRELRKLRDQRGLSVEQASKELRCSPSRVSRIESGEIKAKPGDVMEFLVAYGLPIDQEPGRSLVDLAKHLREPGWWKRFGALGNKYARYIAYETEAAELRNFEPVLVPGLLQTEEYARAVNAVGRETEQEEIDQRVQARLKRQEVLRRGPRPLRLNAVLSEAALRCEVGGPEILIGQLDHIVDLAKLPNVTVQVLRFAAGAHLATHGGFAVLTFDNEDPSLGYVETLAGELFLESLEEIGRLNAAYDNLKTLAMSPAESIRFIKEQAREAKRVG